MNQKSLLHQLHTLTEPELFYKTYYEKQKDEKSLQDYLDSMDLESFLDKHHISIPEFEDSMDYEYLEEWFFGNDLKQNIYIHKHNCYSPPILHKHRFFEIIYVYKGHCTQEIHNRKVTMTCGDLLLIPPGVFHTISVFDESIIIDILIRKSTFEDIFFNFLRSDNILSMFFVNSIYSKHVNDYIIFHTGTDKMIQNMILDLYLEFMNKELYYKEALDSQLLTFFAKLLRKYEKTCELPSFVKKSDAQAFGLIRYIQDNFTEITLEDIADHFHFTPEYTSKLIKNTTGYTYTRLLLQIRMERALSLLSDTNISIGAICQQIGYLNPEHFIRTFKKCFLVTPSEYRRQYNKNTL
ncbi:MAG: transcriptional regulator AraC family [Anaerocolumna sp.]|jgi:AraC-like DNA-binding protein|nr:transcriptional regulator AraC family [Anaerocolumna sp.]